MCLDVLGEVIRAHEALVAHRAGEALLSGVCPQVALQLIGASETLPAK